MLYLLTQHSLYSRKHYPFLLCKCHRGQGVKDPNHECEVLSSERQRYYFNRSKSRYNDKTSRLGENETYGYKEHMDWIDKYNVGISHFGLHPSLLPRENILFDTLHCRMSVTRRLLTYTRSFMDRSYLSIEKQKQFCEMVLSSCWNDTNCLVWIMGGSFQRLVGSELFSFVAIVDKVVEFLKSNIVHSDTLEEICKALQLWNEICSILTISVYENDEEFESNYHSFLTKVKAFYKTGTNTFLTTDPSNVGNDETFYLHVLRFYLPKIMSNLYLNHKVGLGICNMQGFERRNKESKNTMKRFFSGRGNILFTNMKRLWTVFYHNKNGY